jgi:CBS domain-containing protein
MFSQPIGQVMSMESWAVADVTTSVADAARLMAQAAVGAVLVVNDGQLVGIFSGRDAVRRVLALGRDPDQTTLAEVMTPEPVTTETHKTYGQALRQMQQLGIRHMPVARGGVPVGLVRSRQVFDPQMEEFVSEQSRRESFD